MPELPEVEAVRRVLERCLVGKRLRAVEAVADAIVFEGLPPEAIVAALEGRAVQGAGRKGKAFWLEFDEPPWVYGHLGMSGWAREVGASVEKRLVSHGSAPLDDEGGRPRFLKLLLEAEDGRRVAMTDGRRLARVWLGRPAAEEPRVSALGPDAWLEPWQPADLARLLGRRTAPIKALLLDQRLFAGVGNWVADEALYHARLAPARPAGSLSEAEVEALVRALATVLEVAVGVEADSARFPEGWLFPHRWGGARGSQEIDGRAIRRDTVGGRTTAWVPGWQS